MATIKKVVAKRPLVKKTVSKKPLVKAQKGISTAGQAYMKYVPGAQAKDTLGTDDTRFRHPGFAENTSNWQAKHKMLDMTYGEDTPAYTGERAPQNKKDVKAYAKELKKAYPKEKTGGSTKSTYKSGGAVKPKAQLGTIVKGAKALGKAFSRVNKAPGGTTAIGGALAAGIAAAAKGGKKPVTKKVVIKKKK